MLRRRPSRVLLLATAALLTVGVVVPVDAAVAARPKKPSVSKVTPAAGPLKGGSRVTISGKNFRKVKAVTFGGTAGRSVKVLSTTRLQVTAPRRGAGYADIRVKTSAGWSKVRRADRFRYVAAPTVRKVSAATGSTAGGNTVTLTGTSFVGVRSVVFGSTRATKISVKSETTITARVPAGKAGTVHVRVTTAYGTSPVVAADRYAYLPSWRGVQTVLPRSGGILDVSCPTTDFCVAVDENGATVLGGGTAKPTARVVDAPAIGRRFKSPLRSVSCVDATFCVAGGRSGTPYKWDGKTWSAMAGVTAESNGIETVACTSKTACFLVADAPSDLNRLWRYDGTAWQLDDLGAERYGPLACAVGGSCFVGLSHGVSDFVRWTRAAGVWSPAPSIGGLLTLTCPREDECVGVTGDGKSHRLDHGVWSNEATITGLEPDRPVIDCATPTYCVVVDGGAVFSYDGTSWRTETVTGARGPVCLRIACLTFDGQTTTELGHENPTVVDPFLGGVNDLECATPAFCAAVGDGGKVALMRGSAWTSAPSGFAGDLASVACPSTSFCLAVGRDGATRYEGTTWTTDAAAPIDLTEVSCASANYCVALAGDRAWIYENGGWIGYQVTEDPVDDSHVDCAAPSFCMLAVNGDYRTVDGGTLSDPSPLADGELRVSCASKTMCVAISALSKTYRWNGTTWAESTRLLPEDANYYRFDVSCASASACRVSFGNINDNTPNLVWSFNGTSWRAAQTITLLPHRLSCATSTFCVAADSAGRTQIYR